jgi:hypothetical protein
MIPKQKALSGTIQGAIAFFIFIMLCLSFFTFPLPKMINLDTSWELVLGHAFKQNWQVGVDYIFTYGVLGHFFVKNPIYDADLFYQTVAWIIVFYCLFSVVFLVRWSQLHDWIEKSLFLFLSAVVITGLSFFNDHLYFLAIVCSTLLIIHPPKFLSLKNRYFPILGLALLSFAILSLTKFTTFILVMLCITSIIVILWRRYSFQTAAKTLIIFIIMFMGVWILCNQSLLNLPTFIVNSLEITRGYSEAMSLEPNMVVVWWAVFGIAVTSILVIFNCLAQPRELAKFVSGGLILLSLFLIWKSGFVRYSFIHVMKFFCFAMIVPFFIVRSKNLGFKRSRIFSGLLFLSVFIALTGALYTARTSVGYSPSYLLPAWYKTIVNNAKTLMFLNDIKSHYDKVTLKLKQNNELPKIRAEIGDATVDMFPSAQGLLLLNGFNYHPRPIFQGYTAYGDSLLKMNGHFYANSQQAPEFILFDFGAIDQRVSTMEDSQALNVILRSYKPLFIEKGVLLLKRAALEKGVLTNNVKLLFTKEIQIGDSLHLQPVSDKPLYLNLEIRKNGLGRLISLLYQLPPLFIEVKTTDGHTLIGRIVPNLSQADFIINPLLFNQIDLVKWHKGEPLMQVASLRVIVKSLWALYPFQLKMTVTVKTDEGSSPLSSVLKKGNGE